MSKSLKSKTWFIKLEKDNKTQITICSDGYIFDGNRLNLFVMKKSAMENINELINEYRNFSKDSDLDENFSVKCNVDPIFESNNKVFFDKLIEIIFNPVCIKHPDYRLGPILEEIDKLIESGELKEMIEQQGKDEFIDSIIYKYTNLDEIA